MPLDVYAPSSEHDFNFYILFTEAKEERDAWVLTRNLRRSFFAKKVEYGYYHAIMDGTSLLGYRLGYRKERPLAEVEALLKVFLAAENLRRAQSYQIRYLAFVRVPFDSAKILAYRQANPVAQKRWAPMQTYLYRTRYRIDSAVARGELFTKIRLPIHCVLLPAQDFEFRNKLAIELAKLCKSNLIFIVDTIYSGPVKYLQITWHYQDLVSGSLHPQVVDKETYVDVLQNLHCAVENALPSDRNYSLHSEAELAGLKRPKVIRESAGITSPQRYRVKPS